MKDLTKRNFDVLDGGVALVVFLALQYVFYFIVRMAPGILSNYVGYVFMTIVLEAIFVAAAFIVAAARQKSFLAATTLNKKVNWALVGLCLAISVISIIMFSDLSSAFGLTLEKWGFKSVLSDVSITSFGGYALALVTSCIIPAVCEEILFRGVVLNSFRGISKWAGIFVSATTFMLMHGNPDQTVHQLLLGFVLAYIVWETGNIWLSILIHFFNNFIAITLSYGLYLAGATGSGSGSGSSSVSAGSLVLIWIMGITMAAVGIVLVIWLTKVFKKQSQKANKQTEQTQTDIILVDGTPVQAEVTTTKSAEAGEQNQAEQSQNQPEPKQSPSPLAVVMAIGSYVAFAGYFIYEWVSILIRGLSG